jgi:hypothetical protein
LIFDLTEQRAILHRRAQIGLERLDRLREVIVAAQ